MGCFLACFGGCSKKKDRKRRRRHRVLPGDQRHGSYEPLKPAFSLNQESKETPISSVLEQRDNKATEQLSFSTRKKVTFDLNVKTYESVSAPEATNYSWEKEEEKESGNKEEKRAKPSLSASDDDSAASSLVSFPPNHRYQNCWDCNEEDEYIYSSGSDLDDDDEDDDDDDEDDGYYDEEDEEPGERRRESSESGSAEGELKTPPLNQNARDRNKYVHSVLNPVENLSQWKAAKAKPGPAAMQLKNQKEIDNIEQENQTPFNPEPTFKVSPLKSGQSFSNSRPAKQETAVDASLSNWLVCPETKPTIQANLFTYGTESAQRRPGSWISPEDQPILGALTVGELKQSSVSSSSEWLARKSPLTYQMPILGTVGYRSPM